MAKLATLGLSEEQVEAVATMLTVVEEATEQAVAGRFETVIEDGRAKGRERWRRWDEKRRSNVGQREQTLANTSRQLAGVEDKTSNLQIEPQDKKNSTPASPSPRQHLEAVLDADRADAIIEHRKRIKAPMTARAAKLLAGELAKCPDPNAAADLILLKGWRGFEAKWITEQARAGPAPPVKANPALAAADALMEKFDAVSPSQVETGPPYPRLVALPGR